MVEILDDVVWKIIVSVVGTLLVAAIIYMVREVRKLVKLIERHEKILFGDQDISSWEGIVKIALDNRKYSVNDRRAFIELIRILNKNKVIDLNDEFHTTIEILKTGE